MTPALPSEPMTVVRLTVDGYKRIRAADVIPSPTGLVPVRGRNAQGKSSLIESMLAALLGRKGAQPLPIREGEHGADVVVDLGPLVVRRHWKRGSDGKASSSLSVTGADGSELKSPQGILDALVGEFADPVAFLESKPEDQVKTMLAVLGLSGKVATLEREAQELYDRRRDLGRDADRLQKASASLVAEVSGLPAPPVQGTIEELTARLVKAKDHNASIDAQRARQTTALSRGQEAKKRLEKLQGDLALLQAAIVAAEAEVVAQREAWTQAKDALAGIGEPLSTVTIEQALAAHEEAGRFAGRRELMEQTVREAAQATALHEKVEEELTAKREEIRALLAAAKFPMEGVTYDPDSKQVLIGTVPFEQASQGERLKLAATIAMLGTPTIKVMFAREGSLLDHESQAQLAQLAEQHGFQLWIEVVDQPGPNGERAAGVWIEDGEAEVVG